VTEIDIFRESGAVLRDSRFLPYCRETKFGRPPGKIEHLSPALFGPVRNAEPLVFWLGSHPSYLINFATGISRTPAAPFPVPGRFTGNLRNERDWSLPSTIGNARISAA
jgi:hypothetical protein